MKKTKEGRDLIRLCEPMIRGTDLYEAVYPKKKDQDRELIEAKKKMDESWKAITQRS